MEATDILRREHEQILRVLHVAALVANRLREGDQVDESDLRDIVEFLRDFADGTHHAKEERVLFPWMVRNGFPQDPGALACMNIEHDIGRMLLAQIGEGIRQLPESATALAESLDRYIQLLEEHVQKENRVLFVMADRLGDGDAEILPAYAAAIPDAELLDARFERLLEKLEKSVGIPSPRSHEVG